MYLVSDNTTSQVSLGSHLFSVHFLVGPIGFYRLVALSEFVDKLLGLDRVPRSNRSDLMNDIVYGAPLWS